MEVRVLIVEDEEPIRELISMNVEMLGFKPIKASTGSDALKLFLEHKPHIVLLDLMLPDIEGYEVCREIRMQNEKVPIIIISARDDDFDKVVALELGADDYITKPFNPRELQAKLKNWARRMLQLYSLSETSAEGERYKLGDLVLDLSNGELIDLAKGTKRKLSKGYVKVLRYLMRNPNKLISFQKLQEDLPDFSGDTLKKYLTNLRNLLGDEVLLVIKGRGVKLRV